mmetsp:Transcript_27529/g.60815  ORF Transcript_27529/g.60815 Transcript_27529/m.60815 type:complete len:327 (-) Transcript_27529:188-1168(-)
MKTPSKADCITTQFNEVEQVHFENVDASTVQMDENDRRAHNSISTLHGMLQECSKIPSSERVENCLLPKQGTPIISTDEYSRQGKEAIVQNEQKDLTFDDVSNHAISILLAARDCPLVGNHTDIAISLVRLIVSSTVMEQSKNDCPRVELSRELFSAKINLAIDVCKDNIDGCRCKLRANRRYKTKPVFETAIRSLSDFQVPYEMLHVEKRMGPPTIYKEIKSTLLLPVTLQKKLSSSLSVSEGAVRSDRGTISSLCQELNKLSRLAENLELNPNRTIRITPCFDLEQSFAAETLPLFSSLTILSDPLNHYGELPNSGDRLVVWQW